MTRFGARPEAIRAVAAGRRIQLIDWKATMHSPSNSHAAFSWHRQAGYLLSVLVSFLIRLALVALFLPFSAMDKLLNTEAAEAQAQASVQSPLLSRALLGAGFLVEVVMSIAVLTGFFDRLAAVILAAYCGITALLWKQFWKAGDFRFKGPSKGRDVFWDFLKNFALAGGFLVLATGGSAYDITHLIRHPLSSSHPYSSVPPDLRTPSPYTSHLPAGVSR